MSLTAVNSATFSVVSNNFARVQVLLPGQGRVAGQGPYNGTGGKSGTIDFYADPGTQSSAIAGSPFLVTVNAEDNFYNLVSTIATVYVRVLADTYASPAVSTFTIETSSDQLPA